ncbi:MULTISPECIES: DinB family protein [unclassified Geodermatophilus]|uniref:DinB family protein n=1 Tax=unclassified Geodermatophilus TaxID=2637632 RepID=UPI003EEAAEF5
MTAVRDLVGETADTLARQQARVDLLVARASATDRWDARLSAADRARLVRMGHFPEYAAELDWTPREVAGHLRDSALVFTERIYRLRTESEPLLADFVPHEPARVAGYRAVPPVQLAEQLRTAQAALFGSVADLAPADLDSAGVHAVDGPVTIAGLLAFLPGHQRDHADQLAALLGR